MKRFVLGSLIVALILALPIGTMAAGPLEEADKVYDMGGIDNNKASIDLYLKAVAADPNSYEATWKCARAHRNYGDKAKKNKVEGWKDICAEYGKKAMAFAQKATELGPDKVEGYYFYGISVGIYSDGVSILTALKEGLKDKTQNNLEKAYGIDKMYNEAGPILGLGRFWAVLPWPLNDKKLAMKYYTEYKATPFFEEKPEGKIYLAELLIDLGGKEKKAEAKALLEKAATSNDPYYADWAKRLLKDM